MLSPGFLLQVPKREIFYIATLSNRLLGRRWSKMKAVSATNRIVRTTVKTFRSMELYVEYRL